MKLWPEICQNVSRNFSVHICPLGSWTSVCSIWSNPSCFFIASIAPLVSYTLCMTLLSPVFGRWATYWRIWWDRNFYLTLVYSRRNLSLEVWSGSETLSQVKTNAVDKKTNTLNRSDSMEAVNFSDKPNQRLIVCEEANFATIDCFTFKGKDTVRMSIGSL